MRRSKYQIKVLAREVAYRGSDWFLHHYPGDPETQIILLKARKIIEVRLWGGVLNRWQRVRRRKSKEIEVCPDYEVWRGCGDAMHTTGMEQTT